MQNSSSQARKKKESSRAPKYINNILKMAEYKKREEERKYIGNPHRNLISTGISDGLACI